MVVVDVIRLSLLHRTVLHPFKASYFKFHRGVVRVPTTSIPVVIVLWSSGLAVRVQTTSVSQIPDDFRQMFCKVVYELQVSFSR